MFVVLEGLIHWKILTKNTMDFLIGLYFFFLINFAGVLCINIDMGKTLQQIWEW